ncbi:MAG: FAD-dependent oxidoreductase [Candidatus Latescibacteria bacterium]|nr:FAD-dependent oxidoreductase [Candidatus Latescibacterota bacterium]
MVLFHQNRFGTVINLLIFSIIIFCVCLISCVSCSSNNTVKTQEDCDILIVGGGIGGVAAALQACSMAEEHNIKKVIITEETFWLGGQYTSQGVTASDDNGLIEQGRYYEAASELYYRFHEIIRDLYRPKALETAEKTVRTGTGNSEARKAEKAWIQGTKFSPGNAWGSRMSFLPVDGVKAIDIMLEPYIKSGVLTIHYKMAPEQVIKDDDKVTAVTFRNTDTGEVFTIRARMTLDATELGDLLPLSGTDYRVGIEASSDTHEPSLFDENGKELYPEPLPECTQAFTYTFAVEWRPEGEDNRLPWEDRPADYEQNRYRFSMVDSNRWFLLTRWNDFSRAKIWEENQKSGSNLPLTWIPSFWTYRRMMDARILNPDIKPDLFPRFIDGVWKTDFSPDKDPLYFIPNWQHNRPAVGDIIEVNWISNDFAGETIIDIPPEEREQVLRRAKNLSLGFMFWLWYEAPRDPDDPKLDPVNEKNWSVDLVTGKNTGWSNLKFRADVMGTEDGLSMYPYIREARRIKALKTVRQQDLMGPRTSRAKLFQDTVGIGHYFLDIHRCDLHTDNKVDVNFKHIQLEDGSWGGENSSGRFQIPYGSLVPKKTDNLIAAAKNIGLTRIAAATYRLHPVEFQIGQAAGAAAVLCLAWNCQPRDIWVDTPGPEVVEAKKRLRYLQHELLKTNVPLFWNEDCGWDTDYFEAVQWVSLLEIMKPHNRNFEPDVSLTRGEAVTAIANLLRGKVEATECTIEFTDVPYSNRELIAAVSLLLQQGALDWIQGDLFEPDKPIRSDEFSEIMEIMLPDNKLTKIVTSDKGEITRGQAAMIFYDEIKRKYGLK